MGYRDAPEVQRTAPLAKVRRTPAIVRCVLGGVFAWSAVLALVTPHRPELAIVFVCAVPGAWWSARASMDARNAAVEARLSGETLKDDSTLRSVRRLGVIQAIVATLSALFSVAAYFLT